MLGRFRQRRVGGSHLSPKSAVRKRIIKRQRKERHIWSVRSLNILRVTSDSAAMKR
jgi:hypothetical protein